jgi:ribosomal protein L4
VIVCAERDDNLWKSFRNFPGVAVRTAAELSAFDVAAGGLVVAHHAAMDLLAARVGVREDQAPASEGSGASFPPKRARRKERGGEA